MERMQTLFIGSFVASCAITWDRRERGDTKFPTQSWIVTAVIALAYAATILWGS